MLKPIKETEILKRYSHPPGDPQGDNKQSPSGSILAFPSNPMEMPEATFESSLKRRETNHKRLIQWIQQNLHPDVHYGRQHVFEQCPYARAGVPHQCRDFSHMSMITLWKAGAEKILGVLGLSVHFPNLQEYVLCCVHKQEITQVLLKCELKTLNGKIVAEGTGARHIKQDDWNLNKAIKMAQKSAVIDATIRCCGLSGVFIKTHRHTLTKLGVCHKNSIPGMSDCNGDNLTGTRICNKPQNPIDIQYITEPQKGLILKLAGRFGITIETLDKRCKDTFGSALKDLERHHASKLISELNGQF